MTRNRMLFFALALLPLTGAGDSLKVEKTGRVGRKIENHTSSPTSRIERLRGRRKTAARCGR